MPARLGITPKHACYGPVGGESPIRYLHEAAQRIARGECSVAAVCGAEAQSTATKAERAGITLPWTPFAQDVAEPKRGAAFQKPMAVKLGVFRPVTVYPFYEAATAAHWGQTPREAMAESGALWSAYSKAASRKPQRLAEAAFYAGGNHHAFAGQPADRVALHQIDGRQSDRQYGRSGADDEPCQGARRWHSPKTVSSTSGAGHRRKNRATISNATRFSKAMRRMPSSRRSWIWPAATAGHSMRSSSTVAFPACRKWRGGRSASGPTCKPTVTGGLTFFGAPLNTYMTHAACAMVRKLRGGARLGLLYGQGGFVTKHHALVLSRQAPPAPLAQETSVQSEADRHRGAVPDFVTEASGKGTVESFTAIYGRDNEIDHGVVMLRTSANARALARVPAMIARRWRIF